MYIDGPPVLKRPRTYPDLRAPGSPYHRRSGLRGQGLCISKVFSRPEEVRKASLCELAFRLSTHNGLSAHEQDTAECS